MNETLKPEQEADLVSPKEAPKLKRRSSRKREQYIFNRVNRSDAKIAMLISMRQGALDTWAQLVPVQEVY